MTAIVIAAGLHLVAMTAFIIGENRRPQSTFAWMAVLVLAPVGGLLLYLLFGRERPALGRAGHLVRQDLERDPARLLPAIRAQHDLVLAEMEARGSGDADLVRLVERTTSARVTLRNRIEVLQGGAAVYGRMEEDMRAARVSIHHQYYSWSSDETGQLMKAILTAKAAEGVDVRVLYDPLGSLMMLGRRYVREMRAGGVTMVPSSKLWRLHTISYRNHRKITVIDARIGYTDGLNVGHEHVDPGEDFGHLWRDTRLRVEGATVALLQAVFCVDWRNATNEDLLSTQRIPPEPAEAAAWATPVQLALSGPDSQWRAIRELYFAMICAARDRIRIQSPFFIPDETIAEALKVAALRGVDVQIMVSKRGVGQTLPYWAANTYAADVARSGARILLHVPGYLHAKTLSIDGTTCTIGSANLDIRSSSINYELNAVIYDPATAMALEAAFARDAASCAAFDPDEYRRRNRWLRFRDCVLRLASPLF